MCTYNGAAFIAEQLQSIIDQSYTNWFLIVSDDGSTDATLRVLSEYSGRLGDRLSIRKGPGRGFAENFISLVSDPDVDADYFAFADQDDVWHANKLSHSLETLQRQSVDDRPTIHCGRCRLISAQGEYIGLSPLFSRKPSFSNALVQSLAGANTMLLNAQARQLLMRLPPDALVIAHDWLAYLLVTAYGGVVIYDAQPTLDYRQHSNNVIGANTNVLARAKRLGLLLKGRFRKWSQANLRILEALSPPLSPEDTKALQWFKQSHGAKGFRALLALYRSGVYRQTRLGQCSLLLAAFLGKI
ncbi:glycosyltransferase family 2 protein [Pseudomonas japonica]|nr:glycosyltransferase family 2 protein [Pseudomonas japonica]